MDILISTPVGLGRILRLNSSSRAKKDCIPSIKADKIFMIFFPSGFLKFFVNTKTYLGFLLGLQIHLSVFGKKKNNIEKKNSLASYIYLNENFQNGQSTKILRLIFHQAFEKSLTYLIDRKKKFVFFI